MSADNSPKPVKGFDLGRLVRLTTKELRETLRDRRTIITLVLMPLLVYPILSLVFRSVLLSALNDSRGSKPVVLTILIQSNKSERISSNFINEMRQRIRAFELEVPHQSQTDESLSASSDASAPKKSSWENRFASFAEHEWLFSDGSNVSVLEDAVLHTNVSLGLKLDFPESPPNDRWNLCGMTIVQPDSESGDEAAAYFREKIQQINQRAIATILRQKGLPDAQPIAINPIVVAKNADAPPANQSFSLASLIPLILVLMTVTGAVYPAIDLTAGERERGTLETLMAAPVPRLSILLAKFFAVWTVAIFTALLNLIGMAITVWTFQLESFLLGDGGFSISVIFKIFGLLVLFAAFFSAVMLAITSFARSFKEAQAYLIPMILLSLGPGLMAMNPNLSLNGMRSILPMVNVLLLGRDVISQQVQLLPAIFAVGSTLLYAIVAIRFAAQRFGADNILYANQGSLGDLIARPTATRNYFPTPAAMLTLLLLFPLNLLAIGALGRLAVPLADDYAMFVILMAAFTVVSFFVLPAVVGWHQRVRFRSAFAARWPKFRFIIPATLLGLCMWPLLAILVDQWYELTGALVGAEAAKARQETLLKLTQEQVEKFRQLSPVVVALAFSIIPAFCEEWFFRGMVMQTWLKAKSNASPWKAILYSAALFGFFHVLSNSAISVDRLMPTTLMGVLLGYVCYRAGSIWPSIILHSLHNACLVFLGYYQPQLSQLSWFPAEGESVPMTWVMAALIVCVVAMLVLARLKPLAADTVEPS